MAGREANSVKENDLDYSIVKYTSSKIDYQEKSVTTTIFGLAKQKAVYREALGCCLVAEQQPLPSLKTPSQPNTSTRSWRSPWPDGDGKSDSLFTELDSTKLKMAVDWAFDEPGMKLKKTAAVVVIYKGKMVAEEYWKEQSITADTRLWGWSMNKSIVNAMVGVLVKQGKLSVQATAPVEEWLQDKRREIKISDLMHMSSGLKWNEDYGDLSDVTTMLYKEPDCYKFAIGSPFGKDPDLEYKYSSGTTNIVSGIIRRTLGNDQLYFAFPYHEIANKIGMSSLLMETDASGNFVGFPMVMQPPGIGPNLVNCICKMVCGREIASCLRDGCLTQQHRPRLRMANTERFSGSIAPVICRMYRWICMHARVIEASGYLSFLPNIWWLSDWVLVRRILIITNS